MKLPPWPRSFVRWWPKFPKNQVRELRIEIDEVKRKKQVSEIVESDFFQDLRAKARDMRSRSRRPAQDEPGDKAP